MADETVFAAENYSEKIAVKIRTIELLSALNMLCLVILVIMQTMAAMKMAMKNKLLEQRAYTDAHTGLPNKSACEALLRAVSYTHLVFIPDILLNQFPITRYLCE